MSYFNHFSNFGSPIEQFQGSETTQSLANSVKIISYDPLTLELTASITDVEIKPVLKPVDSETKTAFRKKINKILETSNSKKFDELIDSNFTVETGDADSNTMSVSLISKDDEEQFDFKVEVEDIMEEDVEEDTETIQATNQDSKTTQATEEEEEEEEDEEEEDDNTTQETGSGEDDATTKATDGDDDGDGDKKDKDEESDPTTTSMEPFSNMIEGFVGNRENLNSKLLLKGLLFSCLFYLLAHPDTRRVLLGLVKVGKKNYLYLAMALFFVVYLLFNMIV